MSLLEVNALLTAPPLHLRIARATGEELVQLAALADTAERVVRAVGEWPEPADTGAFTPAHLTRLVADHTQIWGAWATRSEDLPDLPCLEVPCPMGVLMLGGLSSTEPGLIHALCVARRGVGVGTALLNQALASGRDMGLESLTARIAEPNELTLEFLLEHDFTLTGGRTPSPRFPGVDLLELRRSLAR